jgi:hypothetical protein
VIFTKEIIMIRTAFALVFICTVSYAQLSTDSLISFWAFNEGSGTIVHDSSGHNHTGTIHGASWTYGVIGYGILLNDSTNYVQADSTAAYSNFNSALTFSLWFYPSKKSGGRLIDKWTDSLEDKAISIDTNMSVSIYLFGVMKQGTSLMSNTLLPLNQWSNITVTYDGTTAKLYINGALDNALGCNGLIGNGSGQLYVGNNPDRVFQTRGANGVPGTIDNMRIYQRALSAAEVDTLYTDDGSSLLTSSTNNGCGCGSGTEYALIPPIWFKVRSRKRRKITASQ